MWMNEMDIEEAERHFASDPLVGPATYTLASLMAAVNRSSDGWPYWRAPAKAAAQLMAFIDQARKHEREQYQRPRTPAPDAAQLRKAYAQLRRFRTERAKVGGIKFRIKAAPGVPGDPEPVMVPSQPVPVKVVVDDHGRVGVVIDWPKGDIAPGIYEGGIDYVVYTKSGTRLDRAALDKLAEEAQS